ncbi:MAG TPA: tetratricopeptide repeat protein [Candidatus Polarisedimenticolaceae bacterium]|nr:tetratricopeptide repeat protein [Candidatus Polarisedimenticolaceae bacterium]
MKLQPRSAKLQAGAGIALHAAGRDQEAEAAYRQALAIWPNYAQIHYNLALLLDERGAAEEAIAHLKEAGRIPPHNPQPFKLLAPRLESEGRQRKPWPPTPRDPRPIPGTCRGKALAVRRRGGTWRSGSATGTGSGLPIRGKGCGFDSFSPVLTVYSVYSKKQTAFAGGWVLRDHGR